MKRQKRIVKIIAIILALVGVFSLSSCGSTQEFEVVESDTGGLVALSSQTYFIKGYNYDQFILYDPETLVMYTFICSSSGKAMSVLYNADGTPKLYDKNK